MSAELSCQRCGQRFTAGRSDAMWCDLCVRIRAKERRGQYESRLREPCPHCGEPMVRRAEACIRCSNRLRGEKRRGENNGYWRGGTTQAHGYIHVRTAHKAGAGAYTPQHRLVWEQSHGQPIPKGFVVHHLNGIKTDNRPENLVAMSRHYHHHHPREALRPYETRIAALEEYIRSIGHEPPVGELPEVDETHSH